MEEKIGGIRDSSDLHAELKQLLGSKCLTYAPLAPEGVPEPGMEQVS
jgi:hypothetical protein